MKQDTKDKFAAILANAQSKVLKPAQVSVCAPIVEPVKEVKQTEPKAPIAHVKSSLQIVDYSKKAIAIIGETKPIKDKLKSLGGRFNMFLTCGPGWIFPKSRYEVVKLSLSL